MAVDAATYMSASLYVGDLAQEVTEALLFEIFNAVGPVASVRVCRDTATRRSLGYAYVNFHRIEDAERALDTMNFKQIRNKQCRIMWSHRDPSLRKSGQGNIFIKNLAPSIDNKALYDTFSMFGNILSVKIATSSKGEHLGYGYVHYQTDDAASAAIAKVNGKGIAGQTVEVKPFNSSKREKKNSSFTNVFVKNLPSNYTKEQLDELFGKYGKITSSMVKVSSRAVKGQDEEKKSAFGFVNFEAADAAAAAVDALNGLEVTEGVKLYVSKAQKKEDREGELRHKFQQLKVQRQTKFQGVNLYIKNLGDDVDDDKLRDTFAPFGSITSAKIMRDGASKSKGFGFVCFGSPEEATKAVTEMNGRMVDGKPLYVALYQPKEQRRTQLEAQYNARLMGGPPRPGQPGPAPGQFPGGAQGPSFFYPNMPPPGNGMMGFPRGYPMIPPNMSGPQYGTPLMAINRAGGAPRAMTGRGGARRNPRANIPNNKMAQGGMVMNPNMMNGATRVNQPYKYNDNVRNNMPPAGNEPVPNTAAPVANNNTQFMKALAAAPEDMKKQMIGERIYPLVKNHQPALSGKITGMLLEMDNGELLHLLESPPALLEKVEEAVIVLKDTDGTGKTLL
jgi:polyadenylate-binding protein